MTALDTTGHGSVGHLELHGVEVDADRVVGGDEVVSPGSTTHGTLGRSAFQLGVLERALELTAEYAREREQFDRPIGSFQAVSSRLADGYIDVKGLRLTLTQAAWRLSEDLPADIEVSTAAFWAADAGHRVAHTTVHVHGGVGIDTDHPVHRYFLAAKQTEFAVGGATGQLLRIGRELADTPRLNAARERSRKLTGLPDRHRPAGAAGRRRRSGRVLRGLVHQLARPHPARRRGRRGADARGSTPNARRMSACCCRTRRSSRRCWSPRR